ncbi:MAG TPA: hypothetical protein VG755_18300 [Nannocystaceae bacterium]|nr:hypothetical protein [Nannocystaceae bacterium]
MTFASFRDGWARTDLRIGIAVIVGLEQLVETIAVASQSQDPRHYLPQGLVAPLLSRIPFVAFVIFAMITIGLVMVARDRRPVLGAIWALAWASLLSAWQTGLVGSPSRNAFFPGAVLLGWMLGEAWGAAMPSTNRALRERLGEAGALACLAAAYVGSCASKLLTVGFAWGDGFSVRALVLRQQPLADWSWLLAYRDAVITDPSLARFAATATLVIEGGAFLLLFGPRLRLVWATLLFGLHVNITLLCTMPYVEPMVLLLLLAVPWPRRTKTRDATDAPVLVPRRIAIAIAAIVFAGWLLAPLGWRDETATRRSGVSPASGSD